MTQGFPQLPVWERKSEVTSLHGAEYGHGDTCLLCLLQPRAAFGYLVIFPKPATPPKWGCNCARKIKTGGLSTGKRGAGKRLCRIGSQGKKRMIYLIKKRDKNLETFQ